MGQLITLNEAASVLGFTMQTMKNWVCMGVLKAEKVGKNTYVDKSTVDALQGAADDISRMQKEIDRLRQEKRSELLLLEDEKRRRCYYDKIIRAVKHSDFFTTIIGMMLKIGVLKTREGEILLRYLNGETLEEIGVYYGISRERARQITEKTIRKSGNTEALENLIKKVSELEKENRRLKAMISENKESTLLPDVKTAGVLQTKIMDCSLSVRTQNVLTRFLSANGKRMEIRTIGDLFRVTKRDILAQRNAGNKTLKEIEALLNSLGLKLEG